MVRIGICGTDSSARYVKYFLKPTSGYELTGCYDPDNEASLMFARDYKIIAYRSPESLLHYADVLYIGGSAPEMALWCETAIRNCRHVLLDEDHAISNETIQRLQKLAMEANVYLYVIEKFCSLPVMQTICTLASKPYLIDIKCETVLKDSALMHLFSMALSFQRVFPRKIETKKWVGDSCHSETHFGRIEFDNGSLLNLLVRHTRSQSKLELQVFSAKASVSADFFTGKILIQYAEFPDVTDEQIAPNTPGERISKELNQFVLALQGYPEALRRVERQQMALDLVSQWHTKIRSTQIA